MKRQIEWLLLAGLLAAIPAAAQSVNPKAVAQLRWYPVNQSATYTLGEHFSFAIGFDGEDIWVASGGDNVYKIRPSDGKVLGSYGVQNTPRGMAFDGANMWVANFGSSSVSKIRASDGKNLGNFPVGEEPSAVVFNGTNIVVISGSVLILRPSDGTILHTSQLGLSEAVAAAFDGTYVWISATGELVTVDQNGGMGPTLSTPSNPVSMVFDGMFMWAVLSNNTVVKVARNGTSSNALSIVGTYPVPENSNAVGFDGQTIWVTSGSGGITKLRATDGKDLGTFPAPPVFGYPNTVGFDGANMWIACDAGFESGVQTVCKL